jgi:DtxR family Mn-dependent transcriptional regulator
MTNHAAHSRDEYLMTIYLLAYPVGEYLPSRKGPQPTAPARIADQLGVSRASVGEMLKRLEAEGLVERGEKKEAILTLRGREVAMATARRHRLVECMLVDFMGYTGAEAHAKTDGLDDGFDDEMVERLYERLGRPERCPHGYPIDPDHELRENPTLKPLSQIAAGTACTVVRIAEHSSDLLHWYYDHDLVPGASIAVESIRDTDPHITCGASTLVLTRHQAAGLFVRVAGTPEVPARATCWADILRREQEIASA